MTTFRAAWYLGGAVVLVGWLAAIAGQDDARRAQDAAARARGSVVQTVEAEQLVRQIEAQAARLHARLARAPEPAPSGRNPFGFDDRRRQARPLLVPRLVIDEPQAPAAPEPVPLTLSGVAEDAGPDGPVRTAILSGLGTVFHARAGDTIVSRYLVVAVGADAAELKDLSTDQTIRLGLR
jgi:hypothetical protein